MSDFQEFFPLIKKEIFQHRELKTNTKRACPLDIIFHKDRQLVTPEHLRYFKQPLASAYPLDLNIGYESYETRHEDYFNFNLRKIEKYVMDKDKQKSLTDKENQQICTSRSILKLVMLVPYQMHDSKSGWSIKAIKFQNVIYIVKAAEKQRPKRPETTYHFKYQQHCFAESPFECPDIDKPVNENDQLSCIFEAKFGKFDILYGSEIAGVESENPVEDFKNPAVLKDCCFVLTNVLNKKFSKIFRTHPKMLKLWIQAYLGCVEKIYIGFKTDNGIVESPPKCINVKDMHKQQKWKPEVCKRFLCDFLQKVKDVMQAVDNPYITYEFKYDPRLKAFMYCIHENKEEELFLTKKFIEYMQMKA